LTEIVNVSPPGDEWKKKVQEYAIDLTNIRYNIDTGNTSLVQKYRLMLISGLRMLNIDTDDTIKSIIEETKQIKGISRGFNPVTGLHSYRQTEGYSEYIEKLDQINKVVMDKMEKQNFLFKSAEKRMRLS